MHVLQRLFFGNYILSVALLSWLAAQICKTIINYILSGKFEAERMWGAGGMPSAHSALVCSMFMAAAKPGRQLAHFRYCIYPGRYRNVRRHGCAA